MTNLRIRALTLISSILHFVIFVWACIDTHHRNFNKMDRRAEIIAQRIIADMQERGVIPAYHPHVPNSPGAAMQAMPLLEAEQITEPATVRMQGFGNYTHRNTSGALHTIAHELDSGASSQTEGVPPIGRYESSGSNSTTHTNSAPPIRERHPDHTLNSPRRQGFNRGRHSAPAPLSLAGSRRVSQESGLASPGLPGSQGSGYASVRQGDISPISVITPRGSRMRLSDVPQVEEDSRESTPTGRAM